MFDYAKLNRKRFGRRLAIARTRCDLTQAGLAALAISKQAIISRYEAGNAMPKDANLKKMAELMDEDYFWLKHGSKTTAEISEEDGTKTLAVKYIKPENPKEKGDYIDILNKILPELSDEDLQIVAEAANALYLDENPEMLAKALKQEERLFKEHLRMAGEVHKTNEAIADARVMPGLRTKEPDLYDAYLKDPSNYQDIVFQAKMRDVERNFPDLFVEVKKIPSREERERVIKEFFYQLSAGIRHDSKTRTSFDSEKLKKTIEKFSRRSDILIQFILDPTKEAAEKLEKLTDDRDATGTKSEEPLDIDPVLFDYFEACKISLEELLTAVSIQLLEERFPSLFALLGNDRSAQHVESLIREAKFHA